WHNRILTRTLALLMLISLLPLVLVGGISIYFVNLDARQKIEKHLLVSANDLTLRVEDYFT
ncbi:MAG: hypothetical protein KAI35_01955, partial [Desulfobulbaceae bacterium]|nr:hypothetical protein [Desulfobulbaceae bacterium]